MCTGHHQESFVCNPSIEMQKRFYKSDMSKTVSSITKDQIIGNLQKQVDELKKMNDHKFKRIEQLEKQQLLLKKELQKIHTQCSGGYTLSMAEKIEKIIKLFPR